MPVIGYLNTRSLDDAVYLMEAFRRGLGEGGFVEGRNVTIEYRWALGQYDRLPAMAAELVSRPVTVLVATGEAARSCREYFFVTYSGKAYSVDPGEKCNRYKRILASSVPKLPQLRPVIVRWSTLFRPRFAA
jgi:hypothetical protein